MSNEKQTDWKVWMLGALLMITMASGGAAWNGMTNRVTILENTKVSDSPIATQTAVDIGILKNDVASIKVSITEMKVDQREVMKKYDAALRRWNQEMDEREQEMNRTAKRK